MKAPCSERLLLAHALDAIDPFVRASVDMDLAAHPRLRRRWERIRAQAGLVWWLPDEGLPTGPVCQEARLGPTKCRSNDRFVIHVRDIPDPERRRVVVLVLEEGRWEVVVPQDPRKDRLLAQLPSDDQGFRVASKARANVGLQRWAVALPPAELEPDWEADPDERWDDVRARLAAGDVPVVFFEIEVLPE